LGHNIVAIEAIAPNFVIRRSGYGIPLHVNPIGVGIIARLHCWRDKLTITSEFGVACGQKS